MHQQGSHFSFGSDQPSWSAAHVLPRQPLNHAVENKQLPVPFAQHQQQPQPQPQHQPASAPFISPIRRHALERGCPFASGGSYGNGSSPAISSARQLLGQAPPARPALMLPPQEPKQYQPRQEQGAPSSNSYVRQAGASQNVDNFMTGRSSTRINAPPGGSSQISFGGYGDEANNTRMQRQQRRVDQARQLPAPQPPQRMRQQQQQQQLWDAREEDLYDAARRNAPELGGEWEGAAGDAPTATYGASGSSANTASAVTTAAPQQEEGAGGHKTMTAEQQAELDQIDRMIAEMHALEHRVAGARAGNEGERSERALNQSLTRSSRRRGGDGRGGNGCGDARDVAMAKAEALSRAAPPPFSEQTEIPGLSGRSAQTILYGGGGGGGGERGGGGRGGGGRGGGGAARGGAEMQRRRQQQLSVRRTAQPKRPTFPSRRVAQRAAPVVSVVDSRANQKYDVSLSSAKRFNPDHACTMIWG